MSPDFSNFSHFSEVELTFFLLSAPDIGPARYWKLLECFGGNVSAVVNRPATELRQLLSPAATDYLVSLRSHPHESHQHLKNTIDWCEQNGVHIVHHNDQHYPERLLEIPRPPPLLYVRGDVSLLSQDQIAIVGSRSASKNGQIAARTLARDLVERGLAITSGLALGIDGQAHLGALDVKGKTIAVIGTGVDRVYPYRHQQLAKDIVENGGAIVSEFPLQTPAKPQNFPRRNRIISGLSLGTVIVEAAVKSGSLITAKYALDQNREVFAMPGSVNSPLSKGCHALIRQGAVLIEHAEDICTEILGLAKTPVKRCAPQEAFPENETEAKVLAEVDYSPTPVEQLAERTGLNIGELLATLTNLELGGYLQNEGGQYIRLAKESH